jgi:AcrR family transcriptional regulator
MARSSARQPRAPLSRERILHAAIQLADEDGYEALTMRRLGGRLDVEAMSLYNHVADKDDIVDGMVELIAAEFEVPGGDPDWKTSIRGHAMSVHEVLLRHPWASRAMESRTRTGPVRLALLEALIGVLAGAGFPMAIVIRTLMALDAHTYGFTLQEQAWPFPSEMAPEIAAAVADDLPADTHPNVATMLGFVTTTQPGSLVDFEFGLDLLLEGLERRLETSVDGPASR